MPGRDTQANGLTDDGNLARHGRSTVFGLEPPGGAAHEGGMGTSTNSSGAKLEYITYAHYAWATNRFGPAADVYLRGLNTTRYRVVGALSDDEFLARGERSGAMVLARLAPSRLHSEVLVTFAGLVDNGRDAQDVMLDVDRGNTWFGWVTDREMREMRRRIRLRLLRNQA